MQNKGTGSRDGPECTRPGTSVAEDAQPELAAFLPDGTCPKAQGL